MNPRQINPTMKNSQKTGKPNGLGAPQKVISRTTTTRLASSNPVLTPSQKKKALKSDYNIAKTVDTKGRVQLMHTVPQCTREYLSARLDPWATGSGACLPNGQYTMRSAKFKVTSAGQLQLGTTGVGFIALRPDWANDGQNVITTIAASVGTSSTVLSSFTNLQYYNFQNLPYPTASFGTALQGRFVAGGIRVQYVGTLMNQNGLAYAYTDQDHSSCMGGTLITLGNLELTKRVVVTGNVHQSGKDSWLVQACDNGPVLPQEYEFLQSSASAGAAYMVIMIQGVAGDAYEFEAVQHVEIIGSAVGNMTDSHTDEVDLPIIDKELKNSFRSGPPQPKETPSIMDKIKQGLIDYLPKIQQVIGGGIASLPTIINGLMNLVPLTGHNPLLMDRPMSYGLLEYQARRISEGVGLGSNLRKTPQEEFYHSFFQQCGIYGIKPTHIVEMCEGLASRNFTPEMNDCLFRLAQALIESGVSPEQFVKNRGS